MVGGGGIWGQMQMLLLLLLLFSACGSASANRFLSPSESASARDAPFCGSRPRRASETRETGNLVCGRRQTERSVGIQKWIGNTGRCPVTLLLLLRAQSFLSRPAFMLVSCRVVSCRPPSSALSPTTITVHTLTTSAAGF